MHDVGRTVESYGLKNGDTLVALLTAKSQLISG